MEKSKKAPRWSKEEDLILDVFIKESYTNVEAFAKAAKEIDRSEKAIALHYYTRYRKKREKKHLLMLSDTGSKGSKKGSWFTNFFKRLWDSFA